MGKGGGMKLARSIGLCFFVIAALVQVPTAASAAQDITLPGGTWNVSVVVTGKDAGNTLAFGLDSPQNSEICGDCAPGDADTFSGLSGELVFYLNDVTCGESFLSTDDTSAQITQADSTHWTIGWDDGGTTSESLCDTRDEDFDDLTASIVAWQPTNTANSASGFYDGVNTLDISTPFGTKDSMRSEVIVPPSTGAGGYQAGEVTDNEQSAKTPAYITFCGNAQCDAQVDVTVLPAGSQPDAPIQVILYYKDDAINGNAVYAQGASPPPFLLANCDSPTVARVNGTPAKCVASITTTSGKNKIKKVVVLVPSGNDPIIGKR
jgi:hypothetical protein